MAQETSTWPLDYDLTWWPGILYRHVRRCSTNSPRAASNFIPKQSGPSLTLTRRRGQDSVFLVELEQNSNSVPYLTVKFRTTLPYFRWINSRLPPAFPASSRPQLSRPSSPSPTSESDSASAANVDFADSASEIDPILMRSGPCLLEPIPANPLFHNQCLSRLS